MAISYKAKAASRQLGEFFPVEEVEDKGDESEVRMSSVPSKV